MNQTRRSTSGLSVLACVCVVATACAQDAPSAADLIGKECAFRGGLLVHLGCGDGRLTAEFGRKGGGLVHGLDTDAASVAKARRHIQSLGLYGKVSADRWTPGTMPYATNLVTAAVAEDARALKGDARVLQEIHRVLNPDGMVLVGSAAAGGGENDVGRIDTGALKARLVKAGFEDVAVVESAGTWVRGRKPRPAAMDEWTHWRHDASSNGVSQDRLAGPGTSVQWVTGPVPEAHRGDVWAVVSSGGRFFYTVKEPTENSANMLGERLIARNAFNGVFLWSRRVDVLAVRGKAGRPLMLKGTTLAGAGGSNGERHLIAKGNRVYAVRASRPVALDAATGETVRVYKDLSADRGMGMLLTDGGLLFAVPARHVRCVDPATGKTMWQHDGKGGTRITASDGRVFWSGQNSGAEVVCLDLLAGGELWRARVPGFVVSCRQGVLASETKTHVVATSAETGKQLWTYKYTLGLYKAWRTPCESELFMDGLLWVLDGTFKGSQATNIRRWVGLDVKTGQVKRRHEVPHYKDPSGYVAGCAPHTATVKYLIAPRSVYQDPATGKAAPRFTARLGCYVGTIPANGLIYTTGSAHCICVPQASKRMTAVASTSQVLSAAELAAEDATRLQTGPAAKSALPSAGAADDAWPAFRSRGSTAAALPDQLKVLWAAPVAEPPEVRPFERIIDDVGALLTQPVIADGVVVTAARDLHRVCAFSAETGKPLWDYTTGGRIDASPTLARGRCLIACTDGWVTCLRLRDGALAWRFRGAPRDRRLVVWGQLESKWPVYTVAVKRGQVKFAAGRYPFADGVVPVNGRHPFSDAEGGIAECTVDLATGKMLSRVLPMPGVKGTYYGDLFYRITNRSISRRRSADAFGYGTTVQRGGRKISVVPDFVYAKTKDSPKCLLYKGFTLGEGKGGPWKWSIPTTPMGVNRHPAKFKWSVKASDASCYPQAVVWAGPTVCVAVSTTKDKDAERVFPAVSFQPPSPLDAGLRLFSSTDGTGKGKIDLPGHGAPCVDGMSVAGQRVYLATEAGKLLCLGNPGSTP